MTYSEEVKKFIQNKINKAKENSSEYIELTSGDIHSELGYKNRMPSVCNSMYKMMNNNDEIIRTTPSGFSSTITIRYYL